MSILHEKAYPARMRLFNYKRLEDFPVFNRTLNKETGVNKMDRHLRLFLSLVVSALLFYIPFHFKLLFYQYFKGFFINAVLGFIGELIQLVGLIAFLKFTYLWMIELWKIK
ncbi:MAG: hypothetical protein ACO1OC_11385 [Tuberibacillus sp.]